MRATRSVTRTILSSVSPRQPIEAMQAPRPSSSTNKIAGLRIPSFAARSTGGTRPPGAFPEWNACATPKKRARRSRSSGAPRLHPLDSQVPIPTSDYGQSFSWNAIDDTVRQWAHIHERGRDDSSHGASLSAPTSRERSRARGRASAHARRVGARAYARTCVPPRARAHAREAEPTKYAVVSKPDRP